jgi:hypothetical protein
LELEKVIGISTATNCTFSVHPLTGEIAYIAGSVVVIYSSKRNKQTKLLVGKQKSLTALTFSTNGKYLAAGEVNYFQITL